MAFPRAGTDGHGADQPRFAALRTYLSEAWPYLFGLAVAVLIETSRDEEDVAYLESQGPLIYVAGGVRRIQSNKVWRFLTRW